MLVEIKKIEPLGTLLFYKNNSAKNFIARPIKIGEWRVTIPKYSNLKRAELFIAENFSQLKKIDEAFRRKNKTIISEGFKTHYHTVSYKYHNQESFSANISETTEDTYTIWLPANLKIEDQESQDFAKKAVNHLWKFEAHTHLPKRVETLAKKWRFQYNRLTFRNTKSQWGSCSHEKNISLSTQLMGVPFHLIDYVILHELTHTIHPNHSPNFWRKLDQVTDADARRLDRELNTYTALK